MSAPSPSRWRPSPSASARRSSWTWSARTTSRAPLTAGDRRQDRDLVAVGDRGREPLEEADVLAPQVDVDEPAQLAVVARDAGAQLAVAGVQRLEHLADRAPVGPRLGGAAGGLAQLRGELDRDGHVTPPPRARPRTPRSAARSPPPRTSRARSRASSARRR